MSVQTIGAYEFPSRSRQELYGDDQLVHLWWLNNLWHCAAGCFRAPKAMTWADFLAGMAVAWAAADPDFDVAAMGEWQVDGTPLDPRPDATLEELGVGHKSLLAFTA